MSRRSLALCVIALAAGAAQAADGSAEAVVDGASAPPNAAAPAEDELPAASSPKQGGLSSMAQRLDGAIAGTRPTARTRLSVDMNMQPLDATESRAAALNSPQGWIQAGHPAYGNNAGQAVQTRLWLQRGAVGLGWGTEAPLAGTDNTRSVVAMRADVMPNTRVWVEQLGRPMAAGTSPLSASAMPGLLGEGSVTRVGLDFKSPKKNATMPLGVFRFQVSSASMVTVRPRSGGMALSYRSTF